MSKLYYIEPGFSEPTRIYKIKLELLEELHGATMGDVAERLDQLGVVHVVVDNSQPNFIDYVKSKFLVKRVLRRATKPKED